MILTQAEVLGLAISYGYALILLVVGESLRRFLQVPAELTRKIIHVGAGMWVLGILWLFERWPIGIIPFATFIGVNYFLYRYRLIEAMDSQDSSPGTVYFAISVTLLFAILWRPNSPEDRVAIAVAGIMAMTWGDALAALIGKRFGKHQYQVGSSVRSWEGSLTMFCVSAIAIFLVLTLLPGSVFNPFTQPLLIPPALFTAAISALFATLVEAVSPKGTDNLSVPLVTALVVGVIWQYLGYR